MTLKTKGPLRKWDGTEKGWQGYHAHVLTSTRKLGRDGFGEKADIELSDTKRKSLGLSDGATEIERIRQLWEVTANRHLEQAGVLQRIDSRSLKDQGIDREPTVHLGAGVTALERDGIPSRLGDINRQVVAEHRVDRERASELKVLQPQRGALERGVQRPTDDDRPLTKDEIRIIHEVVDKAVAKIYWQRNQRVQRVLVKAQLREQRREKAYRAVQERAPVPPRGFVDSVQQKGHQQALLAWQAAKEAAAKLVEQAKRLGQRLLEASGIKQLIDWSQEMLKRQQPELVERRDEAVRQSEASAQTRQPPKASQLEPGAPERVPFWEQPGFDPRTFVGTKGRVDRQVDRQVEPPSSPLATPPKDIRTQAAEGVAAFRARRDKERQIKPDKTVAEQMAERLRAQIEAEHKAAEQKRQAEQERIRDRGLGRGGPSRGR